VAAKSKRKSRRILYISWNFPPYRGSGMANPLAAVNALARRVHEVTVLAAGPDSYRLYMGADQALADRIHPSVRVVRVEQPGGVEETLVNRWADLRMRYAVTPEWMRDIVRKQFPEPPNDAWYPDWLPAATATARALHEQSDFDLVIATVLPAVAAGVALRLHGDTGLPFVLYERDSWVFDTFANPYPNAERSRPLLEHVMAQAHQVWYINQPWTDFHRREFAPWADKIFQAPNGWDPEFLPHGLVPPKRRGHGGLTFRYVGTVYPDFPVDSVTEAWRAARRANGLLRESTLELVGKAYVEWRPDPADRIVQASPVAKAELPALYARTDALVFIPAPGPMVTSGKIYEYTATGLPIVSALPPGHDAARVLRDRPLWFDFGAAGEPGMAAPPGATGPAGVPGALDVEALTRAFVAVAEHWPTPAEAAAAREHAERFRRDRVFDATFAQLEESLGW
jgi:glycosyltransferase involved in cell wall biosynthesis